MWRLARSGRAHFAVPCSGHEAIGVGYGMALRAGYDFVAPHYRDLSAMLALGLSAREMMLHFFAKRDDPCSGGRQPFAHFGSRDRRGVSPKGPQPNPVTHGEGVALGSRHLCADSVVSVSFCDGGAPKVAGPRAMNLPPPHPL